jgi:hypothetical protein
MKKMFLGLMATALLCSADLGAGPGQPERIQFAAIVSGISGDNEVKGKFFNIGPGVRLDFNLSKWLMISPEISYFAGEGGGLSYGGTVNGRLGPAYAGIGVAMLDQNTLIFFQDPGVHLNAFWKLQAGLKGRHWLVSLSYFADSLGRPWIRGLGLTAGYVF